MTREYVRAHEECFCHSVTLNFVEIIWCHEICGISRVLEYAPPNSTQLPIRQSTLGSTFAQWRR